jgi:hypothetical protein
MMCFQSSWGALGLGVIAVIAISQTALGQTAGKTLEVGATAKFIAIGTLVSPDSTPAPPVCTENLSTDVMMVKPAEDRV